MRALPLKQSNISKSKIIKCAMPHNRSKKKKAKIVKCNRFASEQESTFL